MSDGELAASPQPHFIPGYAGFCPQLKYNSGHSYGSTTHNLLLDPTVAHADHLILSDFSTDDYKVDRSPSVHTDLAALEYEQVVKKEALEKMVIQSTMPSSHSEQRIVRNIPEHKSTILPPAPPRESGSPYFMNCDNPEKHIKQGFGGHIPYEYAEYGEGHEPTSHTALCKFTSQYRETEETEGGQCPNDKHHA